MSYKTLQLDKDRRGVARLWLNRPDKHHAMNAQMISELHQAALALGRDQAVRAVVIGSGGPIFCGVVVQVPSQPALRLFRAGTFAVERARSRTSMLVASSGQ